MGWEFPKSKNESRCLYLHPGVDGFDWREENGEGRCDVGEVSFGTPLKFLNVLKNLSENLNFINHLDIHLQLFQSLY